jgi:hypothetical protein
MGFETPLSGFHFIEQEVTKAQAHRLDANSFVSEFQFFLTAHV